MGYHSTPEAPSPRKAVASTKNTSQHLHSVGRYPTAGFPILTMEKNSSSSWARTLSSCSNPGGEHHTVVFIPHLEQLIGLLATGQALVLMAFMLLFSSGSDQVYRRGQSYITVCSPECQRKSGKLLEGCGGRRRIASGKQRIPEVPC